MKTSLEDLKDFVSRILAYELWKSKVPFIDDPITEVLKWGREIGILIFAGSVVILQIVLVMIFLIVMGSIVGGLLYRLIHFVIYGNAGGQLPWWPF